MRGRAGGRRRRVEGKRKGGGRMGKLGDSEVSGKVFKVLRIIRKPEERQN